MARTFHLDMLGGALIEATLQLGHFPKRAELERIWPGLWRLLVARGDLRFWRAVARDALEINALLDDDAGELEPYTTDDDLLVRARETCDPWPSGSRSEEHARSHRPLSGLPAGCDADNETLDELVLVVGMLRTVGREPRREDVRDDITRIGPHTFTSPRRQTEPPTAVRRQPQRRELDDVTRAAIERGERAARLAEQAEAARRAAPGADRPRAHAARAPRHAAFRAAASRSRVGDVSPSRGLASEAQVSIRAALRRAEDEMPDLPVRAVLDALVGAHVTALMVRTPSEYGLGIKAWLRECGYGQGNASDARALRIRLLALPGVSWDRPQRVPDLLARGLTDDDLALMRRRASFYGKGTSLWGRDVMSVMTGELLMRADGRVRSPSHADPNWATRVSTRP